MSVADARSDRLRDAATAITAADDERINAVMRGDVGAYEDAFTPDLTYAHASGKMDTRDSIVGSLKSGQLRYRGLRRDNAEVRVYGDAGVMTGQFTAEVTIAGTDRTMTGTFTAVWVNESGKWRISAWQATPLYKG